MKIWKREKTIEKSRVERIMRRVERNFFIFAQRTNHAKLKKYDDYLAQQI